MNSPTYPGTPAGLPGCVRHPDRPTGLRCTRCDRPACPECLREASVGYQCVDCVSAGARTTRTATTIAGARPPSGRLVVVPLLIVVNAAVFVLTAVQARSIVNNFLSPVFQDGALYPDAVAVGEWWRLVTSGFLHAGNLFGYGPIHLLLNMAALWVLGRDLEPLLGPVRFATVYLVSLLGGSTAVMLAGDGAVGASGAIFGLFGGIAVVIIRQKLNPGPVLTLLAINIALSFVPGISLLAHLGGLVVGALVTAVMVYAPKDRRVPVQVGATVAVVAVLVAVVAFRVAALAG